MDEIANLKAFLNDPWLLKDDKKTVQVLVPKVVVTIPPPPVQVTVTSNSLGVDGDASAAAEMLSVQNKRAALQKKATAASLVAEDYARRFESGETMVRSFFVRFRFQFFCSGGYVVSVCYEMRWN